MSSNTAQILDFETYRASKIQPEPVQQAASQLLYVPVVVWVPVWYLWM